MTFSKSVDEVDILEREFRKRTNFSELIRAIRLFAKLALKIDLEESGKKIEKE